MQEQNEQDQHLLDAETSETWQQMADGREQHPTTTYKQTEERPDWDEPHIPRRSLPNIMPPHHGLRDAIAHLLTVQIEGFANPTQLNLNKLNQVFGDLNQFVDIILPKRKEYATEKAILDVLWVAYDRAIQYLTGQPERQHWLNAATVWAKYRQIPDLIHIAVRDAVVRSASTSPSIANPIEVRPPPSLPRYSHSPVQP